MRKIKKTTALLLALIMLLSVVPVMAFADAPTQYDTKGYSNGFGYSYDEKGNLWVTDVSNKALSSYDIPSKLNGKSVYGIGSLMFCDCTKEFQINIPDSVKEIDQYAFDGGADGPDSVGPKITKITVNANNANYSSDSYGVLFNKNKTELIICPSATAMTKYTIPATVTKIGEGAFYKCKNIKSFETSDNVTKIGRAAFDSCGAYNDSSNWDKGVLYIGKYAICSDIENMVSDVVINDGTTIIADEAFPVCEKITIPESVKYIGSDICYASDDVTIYCYKDSAAHKYAQENDISYSLIDGSNGILSVILDIFPVIIQVVVNIAKFLFSVISNIVVK